MAVTIEIAPGTGQDLLRHRLEKALRLARRHCPVRTGRLRRSIRIEDQKLVMGGPRYGVDYAYWANKNSSPPWFFERAIAQAFGVTLAQAQNMVVY